MLPVASANTSNNHALTHMQLVHSKKPWDILEQNLFFHHWFFHTDSLPDTTNIVTMASDIAGHIPAKSRDDVITFYHTVLLEIRRMLGTMDSKLVFHPAFGRLALPLLHRLRGCYSCSMQLKKAFTKELFAQVAKHPRLKSLQTYNMPAQYQKLARGGFVPEPPATLPPPWHTSKQSSSPQPPLQYNYVPALQFSAPVGALNRVPSLSGPPPLPLATPQHQLPSPSTPVCVSLGSTNTHTSMSTTLTPGTLHRSPPGHELTTGESMIASE